jgi:hypothetical protein
MSTTTNVADIVERLRGRQLSESDAETIITTVLSRVTIDQADDTTPPGMVTTPDGEVHVGVLPVSTDKHTEAARERFFTASEHPDVVTLRERIVALGAEIDRRVPAGRNKSLALTALEDVQMRANRGIFAPKHLR